MNLRDGTRHRAADRPRHFDVQDLPHSLPSLNVVVSPSQLGLASCRAGTPSATQGGGNCS